MKLSILALGSLPLLSIPAIAQTELIYTIDQPPSVLNGWGGALITLDDLDGDGINDLAVRVFGHGQSIAATVHSGATGALLFTLDTPFVPLFWGDDILGVADETGDGISEIVVIGGHSGDANSPDGRLRTYSGADGSLIREVDTPPGVILQGHMQGSSLNLGDIDGDGRSDILCRPAIAAGLSATLISGGTGRVIYSIVPPGPGSIVGDMAMLLDDFDGDGYVDFAIPIKEWTKTRIEVRSAVTGGLLSVIEAPGASVLTGNGEPFISIADMDGDGLRDIALGAVFEGRVAVYSSATGSLFQLWACTQQAGVCMGRGLIEIGDISGDGHPDLLALEALLGPQGGERLFGLDPLTGEILFEQVVPGLSSGYSSAHRFVELPGVDANGFPTIAALRSPEGVIDVRRVQPEIGVRNCESHVNSSGAAAALHAYGSSGLAANSLTLSVDGATLNAPGYFLFGSQEVQLPFGNGFLCVGGAVGRLTPVNLDGEGHASAAVDLSSIGGEFDFKTFQAIFRDPIWGGFAGSDAITIQITP